MLATRTAIETAATAPAARPVTTVAAAAFRKVLDRLVEAHREPRNEARPEVFKYPLF